MPIVLVTIAIMPIVPRTIKPNMKSIQLETNELLTYHCGCHVTIAIQHVADVCCPKKS